jgi:hypothetical protein
MQCVTHNDDVIRGSAHSPYFQEPYTSAPPAIFGALDGVTINLLFSELSHLSALTDPGLASLS